MKCPHCETKTLIERERNGVHIDICSSCRGVWLDRGELDKIVAFAVRDAEARDRGRSDDDDDDAPIAAIAGGDRGRRRERDDDDRRPFGGDDDDGRGGRRRSWWQLFD
jgi:hypothetical protein